MNSSIEMTCPMSLFKISSGPESHESSDLGVAL